jgi:hypothetical protein
MPNFDGGHYFLTALLPVQIGLCPDPLGEDRVLSHVHVLREVLASLPTENPSANLTSGAASESAVVAPFSRDQRTHFARLVVIDDVAYNGRQPGNPILRGLRGINPVVPEPVDHLPWPYLAVILDFDAADGSVASLEGYLRGLWRVMSGELTAILSHCQDFDPAVGERSFVALVRRCQLDTTMSFNDYYWTGEPGAWAGAALPTSQLRRALAPPLLLAGLVMLVALIRGVVGWAWLSLFIMVLALSLFWIYRRVLAQGFRPFPTAPRSDLPSVLKALYLQRQFIRFMVRHQGARPEALQAAFAEFLASHRPDSTIAPTQTAGSTPS